MTIELNEFEEFLNSANVSGSQLQSISSENFCENWVKYKEYLNFALAILPIPEAIKLVIKSLMKIADEHCSSNT